MQPCPTSWSSTPSVSERLISPPISLERPDRARLCDFAVALAGRHRHSRSTTRRSTTSRCRRPNPQNRCARRPRLIWSAPIDLCRRLMPAPGAQRAGSHRQHWISASAALVSRATQRLLRYEVRAPGLFGSATSRAGRHQHPGSLLRSTRHSHFVQQRSGERAEPGARQRVGRSGGRRSTHRAGASGPERLNPSSAGPRSSSRA